MIKGSWMSEVIAWLDLLFPDLLDRIIGIGGAVFTLLVAFHRRLLHWYRVDVLLRRRLLLLDEVGKVLYKSERSYLIGLIDFMRRRRWDPKRFVRPDAQVKERELEIVRPIMHVLPLPEGRATDKELDLLERTERLQTRRTKDLFAEVERLRQVVLLGDPGSGKTTCLMQLGMQAAANGLTTEIYPLIPVFLPLNEYTAMDPERPGQPQPVLAFAQEQLREQTKDGGPAGIPQRLDTLLRDGRVLLLLDALDEMPRDDYYDRFRALSRFVQAYPGNRFVFSCRLLDYVDDPAFPVQQIVLSSFTDRQIRTFFRRYLGKQGADAYRHLAVEGWKLGSQAHTPFFLSLLVACVESHVSPGSSWDQLIRNYVDVVLERERARGQYAASTWSNLLHTTLEWLKVLAFEVATSRATGTKADEALVSQTLAECGATKTSKDIARRAGLLRELGDSGDIRFEHHRLQEYFAALKLAELATKGQISWEQYFDDIWWQEVMVLAAGVMSEPDRLLDSVLGSVGQSPVSSFTATRRDFGRLMLAVRCFRPAKHKLSLYMQRVLTGHVVQVLRRGNILQRVRGLRISPQFEDPAVMEEVQRALGDRNRWIRETALTALSEGTLRTKDVFAHLSQQMMQMTGGEQLLMDGVRMLPTVLRQRRTRWLAPLFVIVAVAGALRATSVYMVSAGVTLWLTAHGYISLRTAAYYLLLPVLSYAGVKILMRRAGVSTRWRVGDSFNRWAAFMVTLFLVFELIPRAITAAGAEKGDTTSAVLNVVLSLGWVYLLVRYGLPGFAEVFRAGSEIHSGSKRLSEIVQAPLGGTLADRILQANTLITAARWERDPIVRATMIGHISTLTPLSEGILERLEDYIGQELDGAVRTKAWQTYEQIELSIERQAVRKKD